MKRIPRWLIRIGIALLVLVVALAGVATWFVRRPWPEVSGTLKAAGLQAPVQIMRDRWGMPNIYAQNEHDLFFGQGYVHAQDRLWQMEMNRRLASGTLGEVLGDSGVATDKFIRTVGLRRIAETSLPQLDQDSRTILEAYAAGVNAYIDTHRDRLPLEFTLLGFSPEPWTPVDSLVWGNLMAIYGSHNLTIELLRAQIFAKSGAEAAGAFFPPYAKGTPFILSQGDSTQGASDLQIVPPAGLGRFQPAPNDAYQMPSGLTADMSVPPASNSWVVSGAKSETGHPILANDPHMAFLVNFYENGLHGGRFDVVGYTFPGVPLTLIGHNRKIAWGITIFNPDVEDGYLEKLDDNKNPTRYEFQGQWKKVEVKTETIRVKGKAPIELKIYSTHHGPLINIDNLWMGYGTMVVPEDRPLAMRWSLQEGSFTFRSIVEMNLAENWEAFRSALQYWDTVGQNFLYADVDGNIGFQVAARLPIRSSRQQGLMPSAGWTGENEWQGYVPFEQLPHALNPASHMFVTANNKVAGDDYPVFLSYEDEPGFRAKRITDLLNQKSKLSVKDMQTIQADTYSLVAEALRPYIVAIQPENERQAQAIERLKAWDLRYTTDSVAASIFEAWYDFLLRNTDGKRYGEHFLGSIEYLEYVKHGSMVIDSMADPSNRWFDDDSTPQHETRDDTIRRSLSDALSWLSEHYGSDPSRWQWGGMHTATFTHFPLSSSGIAPIERLVNSAPQPVAGSQFSVSAYAYHIFNPFNIGYGVKLRMIVDVSDWDKTQSMLAPGASGQLFHPHRQDQIPLWRNVEYRTVPFSRKAVEESTETTLTLTP
jgi:penicillin amidase